MKNKIIILAFLLSGYISFGQQTIFSYDAAGNQTVVAVEIHLVHIDKMAPTPPVLQNNPIYKDVKYYPNPVKSELYMEWQIIDNNNLNNIIIFNTEGTLLQQYKDLDNTNNHTFSFENYPKGIYFVEFMYNNGEQKTFKIIKQD